MAVVSTATTDHVKVNDMCWCQRPFGGLWSALSQDVIFAMVLITSDSQLRKDIQGFYDNPYSHHHPEVRKRWAVKAELWLQDVICVGISPGLHFTGENQAANTETWDGKPTAASRKAKESKCFCGFIWKVLCPLFPQCWLFESIAHLSLKLRETNTLRMCQEQTCLLF